MPNELKPPDFGKCVICQSPITIHDVEGGNDHCLHGHVYAIDHAKHKLGPVPKSLIDAREKDAALAAVAMPSNDEEAKHTVRTPFERMRTERPSHQPK